MTVKVEPHMNILTQYHALLNPNPTMQISEHVVT